MEEWAGRQGMEEYDLDKVNANLKGTITGIRNKAEAGDGQENAAQNVGYRRMRYRGTRSGTCGTGTCIPGTYSPQAGNRPLGY